ncbi:hypothetical protein PIB30_077550 [Stylosanthes scabra]|uniref:Uncharacterized protein n=1 Tax=Stylosanthes scabra TaxID=79078 RepID=A0ABU6RQD7_9FABA|nr:hypothetical protein [Stylosanthes scabra]
MLHTQPASASSIACATIDDAHASCSRNSPNLKARSGISSLGASVTPFLLTNPAVNLTIGLDSSTTILSVLKIKEFQTGRESGRRAFVREQGSSDHHHNVAAGILPQHIWGCAVSRGRLDSLPQPGHFHPSVIFSLAWQGTSAKKILRHLPGPYTIPLIKIPYARADRVSIRVKA